MRYPILPMKCFFLIFPFWIFVMYAGPLYDEIRTNPPPDAPNTQFIKLAQGLTGITVSGELSFEDFTLWPLSSDASFFFENPFLRILS
jgi:hypothetical protein